MNKQYLNFSWNFIEGYNSTYLSLIPSNSIVVDIPHTVKTLPLNYFDEQDYQGIYTYFKTFDVNNFSNDKVFILRFNGYMIKAKIYLNGHYFNDIASLYNPVEINVTEYLKEKNNYLVVVLSTKEDPNLPPFGNIVDYLTFGGIYREVELLSYKEKYIRKTYVFASCEGKIHVKDDVNFSEAEKENIVHEIYLDNTLIATFKGEEYKLDNYILWDIDNPILYTLKSIYSNKEYKEEYVTRFGFRTAEFRNDGFYLNNRKIKLRGLNRHQSYPYMGYAASKSLQIDDANILKYEAGINVVRTSHYPQDESFLSRCDEIGLLVIDEIPGWQHIGKSTTWRDQHYNNVSSMIKEAYNHPSIIAHGVRIDESQDDYDLYSVSNKLVHDFDPYRQTLGVRNFKNSDLLEDIYAYNDFSCSNRKHGLDKKKRISKYDKPYLVTEFNGHMYPTKSFDSECTRIEHAYRHARVIDDSYNEDKVSGVIGWCAFDYNTHKDFGSGDRICYHGVFDIFRNPKYASYVYQSQDEKAPVLKVLNNFNKGDFPINVFKEIYVATNCDYVELYKNNQFVKKYTPNHSEFKNLKHPLIKIDDVIGDTFDDPRFSKKDKKCISRLLSKVSIDGINNMNFIDKIQLGYFMLKYKLSYKDLVQLHDVYVLGTGESTFIYEFKGYKNNQEVVKEVFGPSRKFNLNVTLSKNELVNEETYDTLRVIIKHIDEYNRVLNYSNLPLIISTSGPIELIGPSVVNLSGGATSLYIRSKKESGEGIVTIKSSLGINKISIKVNNERNLN